MSSYKIWAAQLVRTVTIYANYYASPTNETTSNFGLYYSIGAGSDSAVVLGDSITTTCALVGTILVSPGNTFYIGFLGIGKPPTPYNFDGVSSTGDVDCPNTLDLTYCGTNNYGGNPLAVNISASDVNIAITIAVIKGSFSAC